MAEHSLERSTDSDFRCPTCGASQDWSDACRRCRCDLELLRRATQAAQSCRHRCLQALQGKRVSEALGHARQLYAVCPDQTAARLLAVCHLFQGNWLAAATLASRRSEE